MTRLPNLFGREDDAGQLYASYLGQIRDVGRHADVIAASHSIRRYAEATLGLTVATFTFPIELDALLVLRDYHTAWRQLSRWEDVVHRPETKDRKRGRPLAGSGIDLYKYAILYFLGRHNAGRVLLEGILTPSLLTSRNPSYDLLSDVYRPIRNPRRHYEVTLSHFYRGLSRPLSDWEQWREFVLGFHPRLFLVAGVSKQALLHDSGLLPVFNRRLMRAREERTSWMNKGRRKTTWFTRGQRDLLDEAATVRRWHRDQRKRTEAIIKRLRPKIREESARLRMVFSGLAFLRRESIG